MREIEEITVNAAQGSGYGLNLAADTSWDWLPKDIEPVLENQPKWQLLKDVLKEIEENLYQAAESETGDSAESNTILIMCSSTSTCSVLKEYLATQHVPSDAKYGTRPMMKRRLREYFFWKRTMGKMSRNLQQQEQQPLASTSKSSTDDQALSAALKRKTEFQRKATYLNKRRRVRGASNAATAGHSRDNPVDLSKPSDPETVEKEAIEVADLFDSMANQQNDSAEREDGAINGLLTDTLDGLDFVADFDMLSMDDLVVIQVYLGDEDDCVLEELRPRHVIMYEPDVGFVRRVECYRLRHPEINVKPYFLMYSESVEEQKYLSSIRREKESFEKLMMENSVSADVRSCVIICLFV